MNTQRRIQMSAVTVAVNALVAMSALSPRPAAAHHCLPWWCVTTCPANPAQMCTYDHCVPSGAFCTVDTIPLCWPGASLVFCQY